MAVDPFGDRLDNVRFAFATSAGLLENATDGDSQATITLFPGTGEPENGRRSATVTVTAANPPAAATPGSVTVRMECDDPDLTPGVAVVVTADPNVVGCEGKSTITASLRDRTGHIIKDVGFHFATSKGGLLSGPPNTANAIQNSAVLTLLPEMTESTVIASVGTTLGTVQGTVTVQKYCPTSVTTPGGIRLTAAETNLGCGESTFIAAQVRDASAKTVPDGTTISLLANRGTIAPANPTTVGGVLNVVYTADQGISGPVKITAAGGASFGSIELRVNCIVPVALPSGGNPFCLPGQLCITPPNTGSGGLLGKK